MKLPLSALRRFNACDLDKRIAEFTAHHGHPPDEESTFHEWAEVTPSVYDLIWALRCIDFKVASEFVKGCAASSEAAASYFADVIIYIEASGYSQDYYFSMYAEAVAGAAASAASASAAAASAQASVRDAIASYTSSLTTEYARQRAHILQLTSQE